MPSLREFVRASRPPVLSLQAEAGRAAPSRRRGQTEILVRHLLTRFLHHELLSSPDETSRVLQIAYAMTLPTLIVSLFLFVPYHAPPQPRPFWSQVGDHYFFAMYSFVLMGIATVSEWDLLFPDLLDVYVLSVLPLRARQLFAARVLAVALFLGAALLGTSLLGTIFFPLLAGLPGPWRHLGAHAVAVLGSGAFSAASFLAVQGVLLNVLGERWFRRLGPLLQGFSLTVLLAILLLTPTLNRDLRGLFTASSPAVRWFPPFWFVGVYERLLHGPDGPSLFVGLAWRGFHALAWAIACVILTYPLAYRRRVRQLVEGDAATRPKAPAAHLVLRGLDRVLLRVPAHRATFHLASQTVLRVQRHRVLLALYGGLTCAVVLAEMLVLRHTGGHLRPALLPEGIRAAVPITVVLAVIALRGAMWAPADPRGAWLFRSILGRPRLQHLEGTKRWVVCWSALLGCGVALALHWLAPASLRAPRVLVDQLLVAVGLSVVLTDISLYSKQSVPFTTLRVRSTADLPLAILRNFVVAPVLVAFLVALEPGFERSWGHLAELAVSFGLLHWMIRGLYASSVQHLNADMLVSDEDVFPQGLGLRDG